MEQLGQTKTTLFFLAFIVLFLMETLFPFYLGRKKQFSHDIRNLALGLTNAILLAPLFRIATLFVSQSAFAHEYGLLNRITLSTPLATIALFLLFVLLFDLWMYAWHRMNHHIPFLWRFHLVHHSDTAVSASTAVRFHVGEIFLSGIARLFIIFLLGLRAEQIILYEMILLPVILFHHSNINLSAKADQIMRILLVTPNLHRVHHSLLRDEMNTHYGSIFSFWDRIFKTICLKQNTAEMEQGVDSIAESESGRFLGMLLLPFSKK
jgi:sterol desaturase/sphingolipid hydroxylase (fatty acid hydroxylase superfamily)